MTGMVILMVIIALILHYGLGLNLWVAAIIAAITGPIISAVIRATSQPIGGSTAAPPSSQTPTEDTKEQAGQGTPPEEKK